MRDQFYLNHIVEGIYRVTIIEEVYIYIYTLGSRLVSSDGSKVVQPTAGEVRGINKYHK